jgi:hypothetical protein
MAASITHLIVGERVFGQASGFDLSLATYGSFLAGCTIVDVHAFHDIDRRLTHFVGRMDTDGEDAYRKSCTNFLQELDTILKSRWNTLSQTRQAFVAGYLCHLAVDECWKELGWRWYQKLNITSWKDFPVHPDVMLTAFDFLSRKQLMDQAMTFAALETVRIPDVFCHVPYEIFCHQWNVIQPYLKSDGTFESYVSMLKSANQMSEKIQTEIERRFRLWENAIELIQDAGGELPFIQGAAAHSVEMIRVMEQDYLVQQN